MKHLDKVANAAIILGVAIFIALVIRNEINMPKVSTNPTSNQGLIGKQIALSELQFPLQRNSVLLALSTTCHFCQESLPFYKELIGRLHGKADVIVVFPQPESEARSYIDHASLSVQKVISADLGKIGVGGTPTLLLIDRNGKIRGVWPGLLDEKSRQQVVSRILQG